MAAQDNSHRHTPVLLEEAMIALAIKPQGNYLDATYGRGGHSAAILERLDARGTLLAVDQDPEAVAAGRQRFRWEARFIIEQANFARLGQVAADRGLNGKFDGLLLDLGVASPQLEAGERGFSFAQDGPLDMRMDPGRGQPASQWLASASKRDIAWVLKTYGEERFAGRIAGAIVARRREQPVETTRQLSELVRRTVPATDPQHHPATRTFQAVRIFINRELEELAAALEQSLTVLNPGGRLAVISFHSLEDRLVKRFMRGDLDARQPPRKLPVMGPPVASGVTPVGKPIRPSPSECAANPRARSGVLRIAQRTP